MTCTPPAQSLAGFFEGRAAAFAKNLAAGKDGKRVLLLDVLTCDLPGAILIALTRLLLSISTLLLRMVQRRVIGKARVALP